MKKVVIILAVCFLSIAVNAELVTIAIEAVVDYVDDDDNSLEGNVNPGDIITGTYTYDSDTPDTNPTVTVGIYEHNNSPCGIILNLNGFVFQTNPSDVDFLVGLSNNHSISEYDGYVLHSYNNLPLSNGAVVDHISWQLDDESGQALSSTALPLTAPILNNWTQPIGLDIYGDKVLSDFHINAHVTSTTLVPEPAALLLFGLGAVAVRKVRK